MKKLIILSSLLLLLPVSNRAVTRSIQTTDDAPGIAIEANEPSGSIYQPGERINFRFRTSSDAYVIVFDIDTEGYVHLLYPDNAEIEGKNRGKIDYVIPSQTSGFTVSGPTGMEFVFALAVKDRNAINEEELYFLAENERLSEEKRFRIDGDPMLAANTIAGEIVRGIGRSSTVSLAFTNFFINEKVDYPRYICTQCHSDMSDPYSKACPEYEFSAQFADDDNLSYPLERAFEVTRLAAAEEEVAEEAAQREDHGDSSTQIYVSFYPYDSYVYVPTRFAYYSDPWLWSPLWYDPWYWDPFFYPGGFGFGFYYSWGWDWGWGWPYGGWGSSWYPWGYYDYSYQYYRRPLRPWRYKDRNVLYDATAYRSRRDPDLRISSIRHKRKRDEIRSSGIKLGGWAYKKARKPYGDEQVQKKMRSSRQKPLRVKHDKPHVRNTRISKYSLKHRSKKRLENRHLYKPSRKWGRSGSKGRDSNYKLRTPRSGKGRSKYITPSKGKTQTNKKFNKGRRSSWKPPSGRSKSHGSRGSSAKSRGSRGRTRGGRGHKR